MLLPKGTYKIQQDMYGLNELIGGSVNKSVLAKYLKNYHASWLFQSFVFYTFSVGLTGNIASLWRTGSPFHIPVLSCCTADCKNYIIMISNLIYSWHNFYSLLNNTRGGSMSTSATTREDVKSKSYLKPRK